MRDGRNHEKYWDELMEHSKVKLDILKKYLSSFLRITKNWKRFLYIDGFAGRGEYRRGQYGSPLLALKMIKRMTLNNQVAYYKRFILLFVEPDRNNYTNLNDIIKKHNLNNIPNLQLKLYNMNFENAFEEINNSYYKDLSKNPSFFFLDPFGYSQIPFNIIKRIFDYKKDAGKPEILLNLMVGPMNRFINDDSKILTFNKLFGTDNWKNTINEYLKLRNKKLEAYSSYYIDLIKEKTHAKYSCRYEFFHSKTNTHLFDLIHATTHIKGLEVMKTVMYNTGLKGTFKYHGKSEQILRKTKLLDEFTDYDFNIDGLKKWLKTNLKYKKSYTFNELKEIILEKTPFIEKDLRSCLKEMEKNSEIRINRIESKKKGIKGKDKIRFINGINKFFKK
ncbi:MAG: three-Cys-motif partner protein TcmP [Candidatus Helarchaeota archaeon]